MTLILYTVKISRTGICVNLSGVGAAVVTSTVGTSVGDSVCVSVSIVSISLLGMTDKVGIFVVGAEVGRDVGGVVLGEREVLCEALSHAYPSFHHSYCHLDCRNSSILRPWFSNMPPYGIGDITEIR